MSRVFQIALWVALQFKILIANLLKSFFTFVEVKI
jgi:hypothetical protein